LTSCKVILELNVTGKYMVTIIIDSVTNGVSRQPGESLESNGEKIMNTSTCVIDNMVRITHWRSKDSDLAKKPILHGVHAAYQLRVTLLVAD